VRRAQAPPTLPAARARQQLHALLAPLRRGIVIAAGRRKKRRQP
jgi:hypothetical protein